MAQMQFWSTIAEIERVTAPIREITAPVARIAARIAAPVAPIAARIAALRLHELRVPAAAAFQPIALAHLRGLRDHAVDAWRS